MLNEMKSRMLSGKTLILIYVLLLTTCLYSTIINVPADQPTIQAGINVAVDADTVLVQPGTYVENINYNGLNITVASLFFTTQDTTYISQTIIDGNQNGSVVIFSSGVNSTAVISGFTITNGSTFYGGGGGIYCNNSSPILQNVTITDNTTGYYGGGISCSYNSNPSLVDVTISDNGAFLGGGGGIYCEYNSNPSLENVTITGNGTMGQGGGIGCYNSNPILQNVTITGNSAGNGGGICCNNSNPSLVDVIITGNSAYNNGGGIYCEDSNPILQNVTITGNSAYNNGGGIYCSGSSLSFDPVDRCNIYLNFTGGSGWDLYALGCPTIDVIVDTFTVLQPDENFACPIDNFTFDILNAKIEQVDQDLYVSPSGSNNNSGLTPDDPLLTVSCALIKILPDITNPLTIHLSNGTYSPSGTGEIFPLYWRSYISLLGEDEVSTILDGEGLSRILFCENDNNFSIEDITIYNGNSTEDGGGIICISSSPNLMNVTISGNSGGGISCIDSNPDLVNVTISGNSASGYNARGGGIHCENSSPSLENVIITGNNAEYGGGIYCTNSSPNLANLTIRGNSARSGGGIYSIDSSPSLVYVTITDNTARSGGGIYSVDSSPNLENVTIIGNTASGTFGKGGGIYCIDSNPDLVNVTISGNSASGYNARGGGISCHESFPSLMNVTITGNTADSGGGIWCEENSNPSLYNCILWNDTPQEIYFYEDWDPNSITISYSDIQGGEAGIVTNNNGTVNWLEGNIDEDPLFVGTGIFPYSLLEDSPCIDAGNPDPIYYDPEDPNNPGYALYPAMGTIINDMGAYGGPNVIGWPVVGLEDNVIVQTPEVFLHQNYPNPFNPSGAGRSPFTTFSFSIPNKSKVTLSIYNIKGQKVKTIINKEKERGIWKEVWNGKDNNNKIVSSGIYLYKLKTDNFEKIKKMILLK